MPVISFGGLSTGMDTNSIIERLVELEKQQAKTLETRQNDAGARKRVVADLRSRLANLKTSAAGIDEGKELQSFSATSSDEAAVRVTADSTAIAGTYDISVGRLARAETSRSLGFAEDAVGTFGAGTLGITVGTDDEVAIAYDGATDSLSSLASRINASDARVQAFVTFDGSAHRLVITGTDSGQANAISFTDTGSDFGLTDVAAQVVEADDASFTLNGMAMTSASNRLENVIPGVSVDLRAETAGEVKLGVEGDSAAIREKVQGFVDAYNAVSRLVSQQMTYSGVVRGQDTLFGDFTVRNLQRELGGILTTTYGGNGLSARQLGMKLAADGTLSIDATVFDSMDPDKIEEVLAGSSGLAAALSDLSDKYAKGSDSLLGIKESTLTKSQTRFDDQIERIRTRADEMGERLRRQFAALESSIAAMQSEASYLAALYAG